MDEITAAARRLDDLMAATTDPDLAAIRLRKHDEATARIRAQQLFARGTADQAVTDAALDYLTRLRRWAAGR